MQVGTARGAEQLRGIHLVAMENRVSDEPLDWPAFEGDGEPVDDDEITSVIVSRVLES
jgi:hypothetical protein